ncbi:undecaprenyl-phosphate glucose phosphotransferase [Paraburkholderia phenazinium]|jgi:Undecaprenyl-phosphate glucose phosphotransferase|uniref:Undecaprenyl-phosphate glucose phosphotransferase n=1 Tax=Paraburkholderia phenazinium TaxID=60549 RepID=A0A1N6G7W8_9BURK|nr:undecaprenyl-phosphate glucose phosphotransferase [Paraburkholderia phenazinium]SIO03613.1 Undecaprenyl-phosphate glucose phosphotransferase [Paraburkholderia phenazinium]
MPGLQGLIARLVDVALIVAGAMLAAHVRYEDFGQNRLDAAFITFSAAFALATFPVFGLYDSWRGRSMVSLVGKLALAWIVVQLCGLALMFCVHRTDFISRLWFAYWTGITGSALIALRVTTYSVLREVRQAGMNLRHVVVVGHGKHCEDVLRKINASPSDGFLISEVFDSRRICGSVEGGDGQQDDLNALLQYVRANDVQEVWLAMPLTEESIILRVVNGFRNELVNVRFIPDVQSVALFDSGMIDLIGAPAINLMASPLPPHALVKKDIFDRVFAAVALLALAPAMIVIAVAVKLSSRGPVFFKQYRKGADGRVFQIYKFRSMRSHMEKAGVVTQATKGDPRVTSVGRFLRRTSLDELPQFINVLRGEMSVVGPRPHAIEHDEIYQEVVNGYIHRYRIKPGITGWAQVNGFRGETDRLEKMEKRVEHDLYYLRNWSFVLDMRIVLATVAKGLVGSNVY